MEVDTQGRNGSLTIEEKTKKIEIKTIKTEKEDVVHKLKEALMFLENVNVQNVESLKLANLHAPLDDLLFSLKYCPVEEGRCFNDLPSELKADILSKSYLCEGCAYVAASVCHDWKQIIEKRLMENVFIHIGEGNDEEDYVDDDIYCFRPSTEDMLKAAIIHKMKIKFVIGRVAKVDSKLLAEALTTISDFEINNDNICLKCNDFISPVELTQTQFEHLFNAMEEKIEIDRVRLGGMRMTRLDQGKVIDCFLKTKELTLAEAKADCELIYAYKHGFKYMDYGICGPIVDMEQFVEKLLQASSEMKLVDLRLGYFEQVPQKLSVKLANALCKVKSVTLRSEFPLQDATGVQLIKNIRSGGIMMNSLDMWKPIKWNSVVSVEDLEMAISNMKCLQLRGDFTVEQLKMARSLSGVEVIEDDWFENYRIIKGLSAIFNTTQIIRLHPKKLYS